MDEMEKKSLEQKAEEITGNITDKAKKDLSVGGRRCGKRL